MELHFELENKCLLECRHCSSNAYANGDNFQYSVKDMVDLIAAVDEDNMVFLTGGEPLLNSFLDQLIESICKNKHTSVGLFTSGVLGGHGTLLPVSDTYAKRLAQLGLKICYVSIYGCEGEAHDWMTKTPGSFNITTESIYNLRNAGIEIRFNTVVTRKNINTINKIIDLAQRWGATEVRLLKLIEHGRACSCWDEIGLDEDEYRSVVKCAMGRKHLVRVTASGAIDIIPCRPCATSKDCQAGSGLLYVTYEGKIYPCASVKNKPEYCIGNVSDIKSFKKYIENITDPIQPLCAL